MSLRTIILLLASAILLAGCATASDVHEFQPPNGANQVTIYGKWQPTKQRVLVYADHTLISVVDLWFKDSNTGMGNYQGWKVVTSCKRVEDKKLCRVLFDGKDAATLKL